MLQIVVLIVVFAGVLIFIAEILNNNNNNKSNNISFEKNNNITIYKSKPLMSDYEFKFYKMLDELKTTYEIIPQINLASIVKKVNNNKYYSELFRNIDFAIFSKDCKELLLLIEINDKTHNDPKRKDRDLKVQKICSDINVKLIKFYTYYPNEKDYVINRIKKEIESNNELKKDINQILN